jgi:hypothetical protein
MFKVNHDVVCMYWIYLGKDNVLTMQTHASNVKSVRHMLLHRNCLSCQYSMKQQLFLFLHLRRLKAVDNTMPI